MQQQPTAATKHAASSESIPTEDGPPPDSDSDDLPDPFCDPANPVQKSKLSEQLNMEIFFKKDFQQYTGSFKERGARNTLALLPDESRSKGVVAASAGNHALALSYHGREMNIPVTVVMPTCAPMMKIGMCRNYGAEVILHGSNIAESRTRALHLARDSGKVYINGYDHPHILAGAGTMGLEMIEQVANIDAVVVPVGGAGLIAGIAVVFKALCPHVTIIVSGDGGEKSGEPWAPRGSQGAEAQACPSFSEAIRFGRPVRVTSHPSLADGLAVPKVGYNAFATAAPLVDRVVCIQEQHIAMAILRLVENEKAVVEGAGAVGLAAILSGCLDDLKGKRVVIPLCGGNIDTTVLGRCLDRGLAVDGKLVKFKVTVSDRPGGIAELTQLLYELRVSIKDLFHERAWLKNDIFSTSVKIICETRDFEHAAELEAALRSHYTDVRFVVHS